METKHAGHPAKAVVCAELPVKSWQRIRCALERTSEFFVLRCPANPAEVISLCRRLEPSVLVVHQQFVPQFRNNELLDLAWAGKTSVLVLADQPDDNVYEQMIRIGCAGVLGANSSAEICRKAVHAISKGELWAPRRVLSRLARESQLANNPRRLTSREAEILHLLSLHYTNQEIADHLFLSRETVRWHLRSVYSKIGASGRAAAIQYAQQRSTGTSPTT
jgi:DNA-binding NarL/FixJ family response regulator